MAERAMADPKLEIAWNSEVASINGTDSLESLTLRDTVTGEARQPEATGLFPAAGHDPRSAIPPGPAAPDTNSHLPLQPPYAQRHPPRALPRPDPPNPRA